MVKNQLECGFECYSLLLSSWFNCSMDILPLIYIYLSYLFFIFNRSSQFVGYPNSFRIIHSLFLLLMLFLKFFTKKAFFVSLFLEMLDKHRVFELPLASFFLFFFFFIALLTVFVFLKTESMNGLMVFVFSYLHTFKMAKSNRERKREKRQWTHTRRENMQSTAHCLNVTRLFAT